MKNIGAEETIADIEAFGELMQGDAVAIASVLQAIAEHCIRDIKESDEEPDYDAYEDSDYGRMIARSAASGSEAWRWLRQELLSISEKLRKTPEFYI